MFIYSDGSANLPGSTKQIIHAHHLDVCFSYIKQGVHNIFKFLSIFEEVFCVIEVRVILHEKEADLLLKHMKDNQSNLKQKL